MLSCSLAAAGAVPSPGTAPVGAWRLQGPGESAVAPAEGAVPRPCWLRSCRSAQGGCARAEAEARNSESSHQIVRRLLMAARVTCRYLVTPELVLETPLILLCFSFLNLAFD